jgi:ribosome biogenesis GTPase A
MKKKGNSQPKKHLKNAKNYISKIKNKKCKDEFFQFEKNLLQKKREEKDILKDDDDSEDEEYEEDELDYAEEYYEYPDLIRNNEDYEKFPCDTFEPYNVPKTNEEHQKNLEDLINRSDIILEFIDIRNINGTRCFNLENEIKKNKNLILVLAKSDIFTKEFLDQKIDLLKKENLVLVVSSYIREKIIEMYNQLKEIILGINNDKKCIKIGIIGYPNMGKSTFIKSIQLLKEANSFEKIIYFDDRSFGIDSLPGTIFEKDDDNTLFISKEFKEISKIPKPEKLIKNILDYVDKKKIKEIYNFKEFHNFDDLIKEFCRKFKYDNKNIKLVSQHIINDIIEGKIIYEIN